MSDVNRNLWSVHHFWWTKVSSKTQRLSSSRCGGRTGLHSCWQGKKIWGYGPVTMLPQSVIELSWPTGMFLPVAHHVETALIKSWLLLFLPTKNLLSPPQTLKQKIEGLARETNWSPPPPPLSPAQ